MSILTCDRRVNKPCSDKKLLHEKLGPKTNLRKKGGREGQDQNFTKQVKISSQSLANLHNREKKVAAFSAAATCLSHYVNVSVLIKFS